MKRKRWLVTLVLLTISMAGAQTLPTATLRGRVTDANGHGLAARVVVRGSTPPGTENVTVTAGDGNFLFTGLGAGAYTVEVESEGFETSARTLALAAAEQTEASFSLNFAPAADTRLSVDGAAEQMSGQKVGGEFAVTKRLIDNLPINGRNYVQFSLTNSQVKRDSAPGISDLPTSGLSINGQRARFNLVNVDGGNAEDGVGNSITSTVSQEAVQEFNVLTSSFAPEYGHALGGVINVITRGGGNEWHGSAYSYLRNRNFAAVNRLSNVANPAYTRVQPGFVLGGPVKKERTFFFLSYEATHRQETGFSSIGKSNFGLVNVDVSRFFGPGAVTLGTPQQQAFLSSPLTPANPQTMAYAALVAGASHVALTGTQPAFLGGAPVFPSSGAPIPATFTGLNAVQGNLPVSEGTSIWSLRLDHHLTDMQQLMIRATVSPSTIRGIQTSGPSGATTGLSSLARSVQQQYHDFNILATHVIMIGADKLNEARFGLTRRSIAYSPSQGAGSDVGDPGVDLPGYAYLGEDPLSPLGYTEKRFHVLDQFSWTRRSHAIKFGGEFTHIPVSATVRVQSGGNYVFGDTIVFPGLPPFSAVQSYGLGLPVTFLQSVGIGASDFSNQRIGFFAQDSWKVNSRLLFNYGVRYDAEFSPSFTPLTATAAAAEKALGVTESLPFDGSGIAPRVGLSWDPMGQGGTVVKASFGMFFDHPPSGVNAYSGNYNGTKVPMLLLTGSSPCLAMGGSASPFNLSATSLFQGTLANPNCFGPLPGYTPGLQRLNPEDPGAVALFTRQGYLTAGVPLLQQPIGQLVSSQFRYPHSNQATLQIEHQLGRDYIASLGYVFNGGHHLYQALDVNNTIGPALVENWERAVAAGAASPQSSPYAVATCGVGPAGIFAPTALLSFFRPSGINPSLTTAFAPCMPLAIAVASQYGIGTGNPPIPFNSMNALSSSAMSVYHGLNASLRRRMGTHYQFQTSYTWSHAIDNADDFYVNPQNDRNPAADRSNSALDQRHRFTFSGMYQSGKMIPGSRWSRLLSDWTFSPLIEVGSGTPFNLLLGTSYSARPSVAYSAGQTDLCGNTAVVSRYSPTRYLIAPCSNDGVYDGRATLPFLGTLSRNTGLMPWTAFTDLRVSRRIEFSEKFHLDASADVFNALNRVNIFGVNTIYTMAGTPTAAYDARVVQLGLKVSW